MSTGIYTDIELIVIKWLEKHKIPFEAQSSLRGGFYELGGAVCDILIPDRMLAWRIFGEYWHKGVQKSGSDVIQKEMLTEEGWTVVDLLGDDLENRLSETMRLALEGQEMLH